MDYKKGNIKEEPRKENASKSGFSFKYFCKYFCVCLALYGVFALLLRIIGILGVFVGSVIYAVHSKKHKDEEKLPIVKIKIWISILSLMLIVIFLFLTNTWGFVWNFLLFNIFR